MAPITRGITSPPNLRFLTTLARVLTGQAAREIDRKTAFEDVAWYNYHQAEILEGITTDFTQNAEGSRKAFLEVLEGLQPTHILVNGKGRLWNTMPDGECLGAMNFAGQLLPVRRYVLEGSDALAIPIPHTSRSSANVWHAPVQDFLNS